MFEHGPGVAAGLTAGGVFCAATGATQRPNAIGAIARPDKTDRRLIIVVTSECSGFYWSAPWRLNTG